MSDEFIMQREIDRLTKCLAKANANHEEYERRWYLAIDERNSLQQQVAELTAERDALTAALDKQKQATRDAWAAQHDALNKLHAAKINIDGAHEHLDICGAATGGTLTLAGRVDSLANQRDAAISRSQSDAAIVEAAIEWHRHVTTDPTLLAHDRALRDAVDAVLEKREQS